MIEYTVTANFKTDRIHYINGRACAALELKTISTCETVYDACAVAGGIMADGQVVSVVITKVERADVTT